MSEETEAEGSGAVEAVVPAPSLLDVLGLFKALLLSLFQNRERRRGKYSSQVTKQKKPFLS